MADLVAIQHKRSIFKIANPHFKTSGSKFPLSCSLFAGEGTLSGSPFLPPFQGLEKRDPERVGKRKAEIPSEQKAVLRPGASPVGG